MTPLQKLELRMSDLRRDLTAALDADEPDAETVNRLTRELRAADDNLTAAKLLEPELPAPVITEIRQYDSKLAELRASVDLTKHVKAALAGTMAQSGPEAEYNAEMKIDAGWFPLDLLTRQAEDRAARIGDGMASQATWLDYLFAGTAAERLGISFRPVGSGTHSIPSFSAAPSGVQRGRTQAVDEGTFTLAVTEMTPTRNPVYGIYSIEDESRLAGMSDSMIRAMTAGIASAVDLAIFSGDSGANEASADITGLKTAAITESTITQNNKVKGDELLKLFLALVDGRYAQSMADLRMVASVGSNTLWGGTVHNTAVSNETVAAFLRANGVNWLTKGGIEAGTGNNHFGAYIGLAQGIEGAGVAAVWNQGRLVRDEFTAKAKGEIELTLDYQWDFALPRTANFKRLKYVSN